MNLQWAVVPAANGWALQVTNPSSYYVNFQTAALRVNGKDHPANDADLLAPMSSATWALTGLGTKPVSGNIRYVFINDFGGVTAQSVVLNPAR